MKIFRRANQWMVLLALLCCAPVVYAGDVSDVVEEIKATVKEKASCWKVFRQEERKRVEFREVDVDWVCGKESVGAYLYQTSSIETAKKLLNEIVTSPVQSLTTTPGHPEITVKFGDESYVRSYLAYSNSSYVFFRKGNIVVRIDTSGSGETSSQKTLENAVMFAQFFAERISSPRNASDRVVN